MDGFNPLDLLASAAELQQQKHDDGPERIIISRPKRYTAAKTTYVSTNGQKENRELTTNNNITKSKPSVVIVKKIRKPDINSDLEKMLDEHNYGNAKRNSSKIEKVTESNELTRQMVDKSTGSEQTTTTDGPILSKVHNLTSSPTSKMFDSESVHMVNGNVGCSDKSGCLNRVCANYQGNSEQKCSECDIHENTEIVFHNFEQNSIRATGESSNMQIQKDNTKEGKCDTLKAKSDLFSLHDDGLVLNEQTGELILKNGPSITKQSFTSEKSDFKQYPISSVAENTSENLAKPELNDQSQNLKVIASSEINLKNEQEDLASEVMPSSSAISDVEKGKSLSVRKQFDGPNIDMSGIKKKPVGLNITRTLPEVQNNEAVSINKKCLSYDSLKDLEIGNILCTDDSSSSVHLLSPDCRNPDSVGIVSPKINHKNELGLGNQHFNSAVENDKTTFSKSPLKIDTTQSKINLQSVKETMNETDNPSQLSLNLSETNSPSEPDTPSIETVSDSRELNVESGLLFTDKVDTCEKSANDILSPSTRKTNIFCFDSDHCYAGVQGKVNTTGDYRETDYSEQNESEEVKTPQGSLSELSQDSGYEDVTQSPEMHQQQQIIPVISENVEKSPALKSLVPVLVSLNKNGSLTVHDNNLARTLGGPVFLHEDMKFITGTNLAKVPLAAPVGKVAFPSVTEAPKLIKSTPESVLGLLTPKKQEVKETIPPEMSPPKYGKFRIGTFASFSNTGASLESPAKLISSSIKVQGEDKSENTSNTSLLTGRSNSGKSSPVVDTLGSLVQKVKSSLSPSSQLEQFVVDHIQHDHDYCTKNLMPSVVNSFLEARLLSKDNVKGKVTHVKGKKSDPDFKSDTKSAKRKRSSASVTKEDINEDFDVDSESDLLGIPTSYRQKYRSEKYIESKRTDPKVKITGSSNFQDQFVYFMNTKKRSRRRESKDVPLPNGTDRVFIPPKPGDIVVPHLTDQDIENLKLRSKQGKNSAGTPCSNYLRNEFMAAKLNNGVFPPTQPPETVDDEKTIINTILSLENEDLVSSNQSETVPYNESMEMYGQGLNADIMNLFPEQMNLTPEQMDMLYSAVDEVQNSSPDLIGAEKLVSRDTDAFDDSGVACSTTITDTEDKVGDAQLSTPVSEDASNSIDTESAEKDATYGTEVKEITDIQQSLEKSGDVNDNNQVIEKTDNNSEKQPVVTDILHDLDNTGSGDSAKNSLGVLSISSETDTPLDHLPQPFGKESDVASITATTVVTSDKAELPATAAALDGARSSTFESDINSVASSSLTSEMSIPQIDKTLYLLGNDFDKGDLFQEGATAPASTTQVDYNAPWIVTVSMYWNDLPAIMINNQPFVRLVDIHKQILPAKDTGILKKRCQLMGIEVENCSEMQRYFLVQYGKAFNSKSTLIISKDNAKVLIGYYVDPQPKTLRPEDHHRSIVDHRREQLRRIALARRAAIRAQRLAEKKSESDPRDISQSKDDVDIGQPIHSSLHEQSKKVVKVSSGIQQNQIADESDGHGRQRATRHKKINFLEMLRGDTGNNAHEEEPGNEHVKKHKVQHSETKRKSRLKEKKVKVVKYTIETDSSEETDSVHSDYNVESSDTDSTSSSDIKVLKRPVEPKLSPYFLAKVKNRVKGIAKTYGKRNIKGGMKRSKSSLTSTPLAIQVINKSTAVSKLVKSAYRPSVGLKSRKELPQRKSSGIVSKNLSTPGKIDKTDSNHCEQKIDNDCVKKEVNNLVLDADNVGDSELKLEEIQKSDSVVSANSHQSIQTAKGEGEKSSSDDIESPISEKSLQLKAVEAVNIQTDSVGVENVDEGIVNIESSDKLNVQNLKSESGAIKENKIEKNFTKSNSENTSTSLVESSTASVMKRKSIVQIRNDETPIRIIHREASSQLQQRTRSQLGELFVDHYHNKRSLCVRCYTCRKLMSVDNFLHHLHDVSGGLQSVTTPQTIDLSDESLNEIESKLWETFLRKKELFDNNQLPSDTRDISEDSLVYDMEGKGSPYSEYSIDDKNSQSGPRIITTPVSPIKREKIMLKNNSDEKKKSRLISNKLPSHVPGCQTPKVIPDDKTVRTSSRKRKMKNLYGFDNYSFTKFPRMMKNAVVEDDDKE